MNRSNSFRIILLFIVVLLISCDDIEEPSNKLPDVYIVGWKLNEQGIMVATLWKNGKEQDLSDGTYEANSLSVYISESNLYVAGSEKNSHGYLVATLWKNGVAQNLTDNTRSTFANCVYVLDSDIYVVGYERIPDPLDYDYLIMPNLIAKLWRNGVEQNLSDGTGYDIAYFVYISGNDVYVAGGHHTAKLWKNGKVQYLSDETNDTSGSSASSVYVFGNDVYVTGSKKNSHGYLVATLWKNGVGQDLSEGSSNAMANCVFVK